MNTDIVKTGGALAIRPDQTEWTEQQAAVLQQSGISNAVTKAELSGFLHLCQRTGLDPFSRQIYLIGRWSKKEGRDVFTPQTGIDGYRVIAQRVTSQTGGSYGYEDTLWCDKDGRWRDVWLPDAPPAAAKVVVVRNGQRFSAVARFSEYVQTFPDGNPKGLWAKMPSGQIAKCAEALALRKAFPHDLAGVYTAEEMAQADNADSPAPAQERHLRRVQPGETDQWTTPAPEPQTATQGRDYLAEARKAEKPEQVREIYLAAGADPASPPELAEQLAAIGREKAAAKTEATPAAPAGQAPADAPATGEQEPLDVETVADSEGEHAQAVAELRAAAAKAQVPDVDTEFEKSYGLPLSEAATASVRQMTALLTKAA